MNKWNIVSDFITFSTKGITPKYVEKSSVIVLNQKCIRNNRIDYSFAQYTDETKITSDSKFVKEGDILINSTGIGTAGRCAFVSKIPQGYKLITDSHILLIRCRSYFEAKCLNYVLFSFEKTLMSFMTGSSGQSELDKVVLFNLKTKMPTNAVIQKSIASILSNLEQKIELNNTINSHLEVMAKTIYDYWFVQFDFPNAKGKPYKSNGGKIVWNEELKRDIPVEWTVEEIGNVCKLYQPKTISENDLIEDGKYFVFGANGEIGKYDQYNHELSEIIVTCRGNSCGNISRTRPFSWITGNAMVVKANNNSISTEYIYQTLKNSNINSVITGSAQPQITRTNLAPVSFLVPPDKILNNFNLILDPIVSKKLASVEENQQLASLRDWLLPMLMNGQVKVGDTKEEMAMAAEHRGVYRSQKK